MPMKDQTEEQPTDREADGNGPATDRSSPTECSLAGTHEEADERTWMERIVDPSNLNRAWQRVRSNRGAPGIDGMTIEAFPAFIAQQGERLRQALLRGTYRPAAVRRVFIAKPDGSQRPLGIPTVLDRLIQQAIAQVIGPLFESGFSEHSHGYRPGRNAAQAVNVMQQGWQDGLRFGVDCDLRSFFDTVNHDRLMTRLRAKVPDRPLLGLIRLYLTAGVVLPDGTREQSPQGVPQGGPLSPLLANIVLDPLDQELEARGHRFARYADDFLIMVGSARAAERVLGSVIHHVEHRLKLTVNREKSRAGHLRQSAFLGFEIGRGGRVVWTQKAQQRFKQRIREITARSRGVHVEVMLVELRRYVNGWLNYYSLSHTYGIVLELEKWIRRRVRLYYWKQWKQPRTRRRHLLRLGITPDQAKLVTRSRKGYWRLCSNSVVQRALSNDWLTKQGVPDMRARWIARHYGANAS